MKAEKRTANDTSRDSRGTFRILFRSGLFLALALAFIFCVPAQESPEVPRDESRFTLARISYETGMGRSFFGRRGRGAEPMWSHDWPRAEEHLMKILADVTRLNVNPDGHIISFQSDQCFKYPIAYLCEVGYISLSEEEARRMAEYLLRGGFLIVDDFRGTDEMMHFRAQLRLVFPDRSLEELPPAHPIWTCFYDITDVNIEPPYWNYFEPQYFGMSDDSGRLMMIVNYNNDIAEYWEWSDVPLLSIDESNKAYQYGVNYVMYALTH